MFNLSLQTHQLPSYWKTAKVKPIHKKGIKSDPLTHRPISLTSPFCRVKEKIIHTKISRHLLANNLLSNEQHGFIRKRSTLSQHITLLNLLTNYHDTKTPVDMIYLDFSKAFDCVSHIKLSYVLQNFKIDVNTINWIKEYLNGRTQRTIVDGVLSESCKIKSGVPQGSVLGPLLFIIYIEDLLKTIKSQCPSIHVFGFADDVKLLGCNSIQLQKALKIVESWTEKWQLRLQPKKTEHITFNKRPDHVTTNFKINGTPIPKTNHVKDLGLIISSDLKWNTYVSQISLKANRLSHLIFKTFSSKNLNLYKNIFKTYIRPILEYNANIWTSTSISNIKIIENTQRKFTKIVSKKLNIKFDSYKHRLEIWNLETLEYRRLKLDLILLYKILNDLISINPDDNFHKSHFYQHHNLRRHNLCLKTHNIPKSNIRNNFFSVQIIQLWNQLPQDLVQSKSLIIFKTRLKQIDLSKYHKFSI